MDKYIYIINYSEDERELCTVEMKYIFNLSIVDKYIISDKCVNPTRSPFIKERIKVIYEENTLENLIDKIKNENLSYDDFKVSFIKNSTDNIEYNNRLKIIKSIGMIINGEAELYNPKIEFGVTNLNDKWIFGIVERHNNNWHIHDKKPCTYSNSLNFRLARSLVNIAQGEDLNRRLVDPCCGIGTVLLEGLSLGCNIKGCEINPMIGERAKINLKFFDYEDVVTIMDMHNVSEKFDTSIIDIPYGLFNPITKKEQQDIINTARRISSRMVIISYEEMDEMIIDAGFKIIDKCRIKKGKFTRYVSVCV